MHKLQIHVLFAGLLIILATVSVVTDRLWIGNPVIADSFRYSLLSSHDGAYQAPIMMKLNDPDLFPSDNFLNREISIYSLTYFRIMGIFFNLFDSPENYYRAFALLFNWIFITGLYLFFFTISKDGWISFLGCMTVIIVELYPAPGAIEWGLFWPAHIIPRGFMRAIFPCIFLLFTAYYRTNKIILFYGFLGVLALLHPLSSVHLVMVFGLTHVLLWGKGDARGITMVWGGIAFTLGALPYIIKFLTISHASEEIPIDILRFRIPYLFIDGSGLLGTFIQYACIPVTLAIAGFWKKYRNDWNDLDAVNVRFMAAVLLAASTAILGDLSVTVLQLQPLRILKHIFPFIIIYSFAPVFVKVKRQRLREYLVPLLVVGLITSIPVYSCVKDYTEPRGDFNLSGAVVKLTSNWQDFRELCTWCADTTPKNSVFLVPPGGMALFRVFSKRGIVVCYKDGCTSAFDGAYADEWYHLYMTVSQAYEAENTHTLLVAAKEFGAEYIVTKSAFPIESMDPVHTNPAFSVYRVGKP